MTTDHWAIPTEEQLLLLSASCIQISNVVPAGWLSFPACGLRINMETGEVVIPEGLSLDDASRAFWTGLGGFWSAVR
jgi:hypothetical protein